MALASSDSSLVALMGRRLSIIEFDNRKIKPTYNGIPLITFTAVYNSSGLEWDRLGF